MASRAETTGGIGRALLHSTSIDTTEDGKLHRSRVMAKGGTVKYVHRYE
jgi:hypothetical protein